MRKSLIIKMVIMPRWKSGTSNDKKYFYWKRAEKVLTTVKNVQKGAYTAFESIDFMCQFRIWNAFLWILQRKGKNMFWAWLDVIAFFFPSIHLHFSFHSFAFFISFICLSHRKIVPLHPLLYIRWEMILPSQQKHKYQNYYAGY